MLYNSFMGRKPKKPADKKTNVLKVMMTEGDRAAIEKEAAVNGMEASTWVRLKILEIVRKSAKK